MRYTTSQANTYQFQCPHIIIILKISHPQSFQNLAEISRIYTYKTGQLPPNSRIGQSVGIRFKKPHPPYDGIAEWQCNMTQKSKPPKNNVLPIIITNI